MEYETLVKENRGDAEFQINLATACDNIGTAEIRRDRTAAAIPWQERALTIRENLARENPAVTQYRYDLALSHFNIGVAHVSLNRLQEAIKSILQATAIMEVLVEAEPNRSGYVDVLAKCLGGLGSLQMKNGQSAGAVESLRRAIRHRGDQSNPTTESYF